MVERAGLTAKLGFKAHLHIETCNGVCVGKRHAGAASLPRTLIPAKRDLYGLSVRHNFTEADGPRNAHLIVGTKAANQENLEPLLAAIQMT